MNRNYPNIQNSIIKIVGLLEEKPGLQSTLLKNEYVLEGLSDEYSGFFKDYFYPDFRSLMFFEHNRINNRRYKKEINKAISLSDSIHNEELVIKDAEVLLFGEEYIALLCISVQLENKKNEIENIANLLNLVRQFDTVTDSNIKWYNWIENELLGGIKIRGRGVSVDEYSGSKFKLFTVLDFENDLDNQSRMKLLYDLGTSSPLGSSGDNITPFTPHADFFSKIMKNKLSVFKNWEALSLLDTFTVVGNNILVDPNQFKTWGFTYFRIYLFRVFFKYNLSRYNSLMSSDEKVETLRTKYEEFLNTFDTFPISYNFLPNELFRQIGKGLSVQMELDDFHKRITRMTEIIKEKKQERMNLLLELISVIGAGATVAAIPLIMEQLKQVSGLSAIVYYTFLTLVMIILISILFRFLKPVLKIKTFIKKKFRK